MALSKLTPTLMRGLSWIESYKMVTSVGFQTFGLGLAGLVVAVVS